MQRVRNDKEDSVQMPFAGYQLLDLTDERGFLCGKILAEMGALVIKVEKPEGDSSRNMSPFYHDVPDPERSLYWFAYNTSKKGITLDITSAEGQDIFKKLVRGSDGVIESFPPGYLDNLGLGWSDLRKINSAIILTSITPFGRKGPFRNYKISDLTAQALSGLTYTCGEPDSPGFLFAGSETRQAYLQSGLQAATGTLIALYWRALSGEGQVVDVSIAECMAQGSGAGLIALEWQLGKNIIKKEGDRIRRGAKVSLRAVYPCRDGYVSTRILAGGMGNLFQPLVEWMDSEGMAEDLKDIDWTKVDILKLTQEEVQHYEEVLDKFFQRHSRAEIDEQALRRGFMAYPFIHPKDLIEDVQLKDRGFFVEVNHPELGASLVYPGMPYKSSGCPPSTPCRAPLIGEHNNEVYQKLGMSEKDIAELKKRSII
jgi:crotonobetainyl-CoA:carnitine CoA-transferase CaiB-like acyl-CoA transferase